MHPKAFAISRRSVCISTVGPSPKLIARAVSTLPCRLAWSVHAADDHLRRQLVPTTRHSMAELRDAFHDALASKPARVRGLVVELALIAGVNDAPHHAEQARELRPAYGADCFRSARAPCSHATNVISREETATLNSLRPRHQHSAGRSSTPDKHAPPRSGCPSPSPLISQRSRLFARARSSRT